MTRTVLGLAALFLAVVGAACAAPATPLGHIDVPLTASGAGGVIYRLPPGTSLELVSNSTTSRTLRRLSGAPQCR